jgi:hypothetical protein
LLHILVVDSLLTLGQVPCFLLEGLRFQLFGHILGDHISGMLLLPVHQLEDILPQLEVTFCLQLLFLNFLLVLIGVALLISAFFVQVFNLII